MLQTPLKIMTVNQIGYISLHTDIYNTRPLYLDPEQLFGRLVKLFEQYNIHHLPKVQPPILRWTPICTWAEIYISYTNPPSLNYILWYCIFDAKPNTLLEWDYSAEYTLYSPVCGRVCKNIEGASRSDNFLGNCVSGKVLSSSIDIAAQLFCQVYYYWSGIYVSRPHYVL